MLQIGEEKFRTPFSALMKLEQSVGFFLYHKLVGISTLLLGKEVIIPKPMCLGGRESFKSNQYEGGVCLFGEGGLHSFKGLGSDGMDLCIWREVVF